MANQTRQIIVIGPLPPPVHGMATTNAAVCAALLAQGASLLALNTASSSLRRSLLYRVGRAPRAIAAVLRLMQAPIAKRASLYMSVSGGWGQLYELGFAVVGRFRGMRIYMRHCSYAYLDEPSLLARLLIASAGSSAAHITQSPGMGGRLCQRYGVSRVIPISNAVLYGDAPLEEPYRAKLATIGFLSNVSADKGILDFLDLLEEAKSRGLPVYGKIAGGFDDAQIKSYVLGRLQSLEHVEYVGAVYGADKDAFFSSVDLFVFPTRYKNETEAKVNHEAMSRGIPVIAYGRGCIPEIVNETCGLVIDPKAPFLPEAIRRIERWVASPEEFQVASAAAAAQFLHTKKASQARWRELIAELVDEAPMCAGGGIGDGR